MRPSPLYYYLTVPYDSGSTTVPEQFPFPLIVTVPDSASMESVLKFSDSYIR